MTTMIALVGEQPLPNLLPALHYAPDCVLLAHTELTTKTACRLEAILSKKGINARRIGVDSVKTLDIYHCLKAAASHRRDLIFNLTGGTKAMVLAANLVAQEQRSRVVYLESAKAKNTIYSYSYANKGLQLLNEEVLPTLLDIDTYLNVQLGAKGTMWRMDGYSTDIGGQFEETIGHALNGHVDELCAGIKFLGDEASQQKRPQADLDIVVRIGNQIGVIEVKDQKGSTLDAIKQLNYLSLILGTFTAKFWASSQEANLDHKAVAEVTRTVVIELTSYRSQKSLNGQDQKCLVDAVRKRLVA